MGIIERIRRSIALKIIVPQIVVIILAIIVVLIFANSGIKSLREEAAKDEAIFLAEEINTFLASRKNIFLTGVGLVSHDAVLIEAVATGDNTQAMHYLVNLGRNVLAPILRVNERSATASTIAMQVINANGRIIASTSTKNHDGFVSQAIGEDISNHWSFKKMSATSGYLVTTDYDRQGIVLRALAPIVKDGVMIGAFQIIEDITSAIDSFILFKQDTVPYIYLLNLSEKYNDFATNVKKELFFRGGLVLNYKDVELPLLAEAEKAGTNPGMDMLLIADHFVMPVNLSTTPNTSSDTTITPGEYIGTVYFAAPDKYVLDVANKGIGLSFRLLIFFVFTASFSTALVLVLFVLYVVRPMRHLAVALRDLSEEEGDLNTRLGFTATDEIGRAAGYVDKFIEKIHNTVAVAVDTSSETSSSSEELSSTSYELSLNIAQQMLLVNDTEDLIADIGKNLEIAESSAMSTTEDLEETRKVFDSFVTSLSGLVTVVNEENEQQRIVSEKMTEVTDRVKEVTAVLKIISEIADQTNLLALNASIEAARAGEHGKGFAVVADEVRKLAERTQESLDSINKTAKTINQSVTEVYKLVEKSTAGIKEAATGASMLIEESNKAVARLNNSTEVSNDVVQKTTYIAAKVKELISGANSLVDLSANNKMASENVNRVAEHLATRSNELNKVLGKFQV